MLKQQTFNNHPNPITQSLKALNGKHHAAALISYMFVVFGHFGEHVIQLYQIFVLHMHPKIAGGILGYYYPKLAQNEVLHISYNSLQLTGLILLALGFQSSSKQAKRWWSIAIIAQSWHFTEHVILQVQYLTGNYLFGALHQKSLLEFVFPRVQLHFTYNLLALIPTLIAVYFYFRHKRANA